MVRAVQRSDLLRLPCVEMCFSAGLFLCVAPFSVYFHPVVPSYLSFRVLFLVRLPRSPGARLFQ